MLSHSNKNYSYRDLNNNPFPHSEMYDQTHNLSDQTNTVIIQRPTNYAKSLAYRIVSVIFFLAFTIAISVLLAQSHSEDDKGACGKNLWPLVLVRLIGNGLEWLILFILGVSTPPPGLLQILLTVSKLAFAIALTIVVPAAVSGGCTQVSGSWYALVVFSYLFMVVDWIAAVAGIIIALTTGSR